MLKSINKFLKFQAYEDLGFFRKMIYKYRLAKALKTQCKFTVMMDSLLDCRSEKGFNELLREEF